MNQTVSSDNKRLRLQIFFISILLIGTCLRSEASDAMSLPTKYLMSFHACNASTTNCNDPRNHKVYIAQSDDGINWSPLPGYAPYSGSVPDIIRRGNTLYVYTPGQVRRYQIDSNTWKDAATVSNALKIHVPFLSYSSLYFWADFDYVQNTSDFSLSNYGQVTESGNFSSCQPSTLSSDFKLHIPEAVYNNISYNADFQYSHDLIFTLTGASPN